MVRGRLGPRPRSARGVPDRTAKQQGWTATVTETVDYTAVWSAAIQDLNEEIGSAQKRGYLSLAVLIGMVGDTALLAVPDAHTRDVIEAQLRTVITEALSRHLGQPVTT